ncbi:MAG: enoyl-CoA hydratase/isomerase family protein, partial [Clostridia bacterium]|nr:enoyl-CoA hydratase/isomerase family protein [Clostridia bacterium]
PYVRYEVADHVATILIDRPEMKNALDFGAVEAIAACVRAAGEDPDVRAIVITGVGDAFSSGGELDEIERLRQLTPLAIRRNVYGKFQGMVRAVKDVEKPVIAAINGVAVGAAFDLALACDLRLAADTARMGEVWVRLGVIPGMGGMYLLPQIVGIGKANELAFTGDLIDAYEALRIGLVNRVVPAAELREEAMRWARRLAAGPTPVIGIIKKGIIRSYDSTLAAELEFAGYVQGGVMQERYYAEGLAATRERRAPRFHED